VFDVEEVFLISDAKNEYEKIRKKRGQNNAYSYSLAIRKLHDSQEHRVEQKQIISAREYILLFEKRDPKKKVIKKKDMLLFGINNH